MSNVNKVILVGQLGQDPELRHTAKGNAVLTISVATNKDIKSAEGEKKKQTQWHKAVVWGKQAEVCAKYLTKGSRIYLEGELRTQKWEDKDGIERKTAEISVADIRFLGGGNFSGTNMENRLEPSAHLSQ